MSLVSEKKPAPYWNSYLAGIGLGLVLLAAFVLMGRGLGASGAVTRFASYSMHKADVALSGGTEAEGRSWALRNAYMSEYLPAEGDPFDDFLVYLFFGIIVGGFVSGFSAGRVRFETIRGPNTTDRKRLVLALLGGIVSAYGARLARGCTSGQALTGGATLALGSWAFMLSVFAGGYALAYFMRKEWL